MQIFSFYFFRGPFCINRFEISQGDWGKNAGTLLSITFFTNMLVAYFNDKYKKPRLVLSILLIGATISFEMLFLIDRKSILLFWMTLACYLLFETGVTPLLDHHCIQFLQNTPGTDATAYGRQRLWGAIAYMTTNYITESLCKNKDGTFDFEPLKYTVPLLTVPGLIVIFFVVQNYEAEHFKMKSKQKANGQQISNDDTRENQEVTDKQVVIEQNKSEDATGNTAMNHHSSVEWSADQFVSETVIDDTINNQGEPRTKLVPDEIVDDCNDVQNATSKYQKHTWECDKRIQIQNDSDTTPNEEQQVSNYGDGSEEMGFRKLTTKDADEMAVKHTGMVSPVIALGADISFGRQFSQLLRNPDFLFFIFLIFLNGITRSANNLYISLYQTRVLKLKGVRPPDSAPVFAQKLINGLGENAISTANSCSTVVEMIFLFLSLNITKHFGLYWPLFFAQFAQTIRNLGYFLMPPESEFSFLITCLLETAKGVNFSLTHASGVQIVNNISPLNLKSTAQIIYAGAFFSLSSFISGQTFGRLFGPLKDENDYKKQLLSFRRVFCINFCINIVFLGLFIIKYGFLDRRLPFNVFFGTKYRDTMKQKRVITTD